jgi:hypothetical protein
MHRGAPLVRGPRDPEEGSGYLSGRTTLRLLQQCPNIVEFCANISKLEDDPPLSHYSIVQAPRLTRLTINENTQLPAFAFFDSLDLPALRSLTLSSTSDYYIAPSTYDDKPSARILLRKIGSQLDSLAFGFLDLAIPEISDCLRATPNLRELILDLSGGFRAPGPETTPSNPVLQPPPYSLRN